MTQKHCVWTTILVAAIVACGCGRTNTAVPQSREQLVAMANDGSTVTSVALRARSTGPGPLFRKRTAGETGIKLVHQFPSDASLALLSDQYSGMGVCAGDIDGDNLPDLFVTNYDQGNRLYKNLGGFRFEDVTQQAGVGGTGKWCAGSNFVDIDNDGDLDLFVCVFNQANLLFINRGDGTFSEQAQQFGLDFAGASVMMAFADYDLDGDLDGYLVTHRVKVGADYLLPRNTRDAIRKGIIEITRDKQVRIKPRFQDLFEVVSKGPGRIALIIAGQEDVLYRNDGGRFVRANHQAGLSGHGIGLAATWWDFNNDNYPDLYVSNDYKGADQLYRNNGDGTFTDVVRSVLPHVPWYSMGTDIGDINNDGWMDFVATDMSGTTHFKQKMAMGDMSDDAWFMDLAEPPQYMRNALYLNSGAGSMLEVAKLAGISSTDWTWSPKFGDLNNDGRVDLFVANGMSRDFMNSDENARIQGRYDEQWKSQPVLRESNLAYRNTGKLKFEDASESWGLDEMTASYGVSFADFDRDGALDIVATNFDGELLVYQNTESTGNGMLLRLKGVSSNRWGIGARVTLETASGRQTRYVNTTQGFMSANEPIIHFGLIDDVVDRLTIHWPSGVEQSLSKMSANFMYTITEPEKHPITPSQLDVSPLFARVDSFSEIRHQELPFDDYVTQPLLPGKRSQLGPGLATADLNDDGIDDFFFGGASGSPGQLRLSGNATTSSIPAFAADAACEDMGALFLDADSDGDLDLYVVSGGVEHKEGDPRLRDRLYLQNDGEFTKAEAALPNLAESGSCVCAADYDGDDDLDLFVGGRIIPGRYPLAPPSRIFRNDDGRFTDVTADVAPDLLTGRMVTGAIWTDANGDHAIDLIVTHEWGTIDVLINDDGKLSPGPGSVELAKYTGWWNGIAGGDIDHDGDMDYVVTNLGLNTKYHADDQHPVRLYYGDFENDGNPHVVEAKYENGVLLPERGRSCSTAAMPVLGKRFKTYQGFALAGLEEVYSPLALGNAVALSATTLESGILVNNGDARFEFHPLPRLAQIAPASGASLVDVDGDGNLDLILAHNDFSPQRETGHMDGGVSLLLRGTGKGQFEPIWPNRSGISIMGDAQCLVATDFNNDSHPDLLFGINDREWVGFQNQANDRGKRLTIRLRGRPGNTLGVGAKVRLIMDDGLEYVQEVRAGEGYLSQGSSQLSFGLTHGMPKTVEVRWADGIVQQVAPQSSPLIIRQPPRLVDHRR